MVCDTSLKSEVESRQVGWDVLQLKTIIGLARWQCLFQGKLRSGHLPIRPCVCLRPQGEHLSQARLPGGPRGWHERENILEQARVAMHLLPFGAGQ